MLALPPTRVSYILSRYSDMTLSGHSTNDTEIAGLSNFALQGAKSLSVTLRARLHAPQA